MWNELAEKIINLEEGESFNWIINDGFADIIMGAKCIDEFDSKIVIMGSYGGGFNSSINIEFVNINYVEEILKETYKEVKFSGFSD